MKNKKLIIIGLILVLFAVSMCAISAVDSDSANTDNYTLQINATGKWRLDLTVDGNYSSDEGDSSKTIDLGPELEFASVTVNQYEKGPTQVCLLKGNETLENQTTDGDGVKTIYFYYQEDK